jgi:hypothetical protein
MSSYGALVPMSKRRPTKETQFLLEDSNADNDVTNNLRPAQRKGHSDVAAFLQRLLVSMTDSLETTASASVTSAVMALTSKQDRMQALDAGTKETFTVTDSYIKSILTDEVLGRGFVGTIYRGIDRS